MRRLKSPCGDDVNIARPHEPDRPIWLNNGRRQLGVYCEYHAWYYAKPPAKAELVLLHEKTAAGR